MGVCKPCLRRRYYQANPEYYRRKAALKRVRKPDAGVLQDTRNSDRKKGRVGNDLDRAFVKVALARSCTYCGTTTLQMTLDRIDNALAHTKANTMPACIRCNYMRGSMPYEAWLHIVPAVREAVTLGLFGEWRSKCFNRKHEGLTLLSQPQPSAPGHRAKRVRRPKPPKVAELFTSTSRIDWPSPEELAASVAASSLRVVARQLGCSHVAVGKRLGRYKTRV